jgi:hypothetical protein
VTTRIGCASASTRISEPSSPTRTSPPRTVRPRGRKTARCRPAESSASNRLFWRVSQSSATTPARRTSAGARPRPATISLLTTTSGTDVGAAAPQNRK